MAKALTARPDQTVHRQKRTRVLHRRSMIWCDLSIMISTLALTFGHNQFYSRIEWQVCQFIFNLTQKYRVFNVKQQAQTHTPRNPFARKNESMTVFSIPLFYLVKNRFTSILIWQNVQYNIDENNMRSMTFIFVSLLTFIYFTFFWPCGKV